MKDDLFELLADKLRKAEHGETADKIFTIREKGKSFAYGYRFGSYSVRLDNGLSAIPGSNRNCNLTVEKVDGHGRPIDDYVETFKGEDVNDLFFEIEEGREEYDMKKAEEKRLLDARIESEKRQRKYEFKEELKDCLLNGD